MMWLFIWGGYGVCLPRPPTGRLLVRFPHFRTRQALRHRHFANHFYEANNGDQNLACGFSSPPPHNQGAILCIPFFNGPKEEAEMFFADLLALGPIVYGTGTLHYEK